MQLIERTSPTLSLSQQCRLLSLNRSSLYLPSASDRTEQEQDLMNEIHELYLQLPFYGYRRIRVEL